MIVRNAGQFLQDNGINPSPENCDQLKVFLEALEIYDSRTSAYGQVWKQYGALSNLLSVARKTDRLMEYWWHDQDMVEVPLLHKDSLDDAIDLINYTIFFIRNARVANITGDRPKRPDEASR